MKKERALVGSLVLVQLALWLGFLIHRSPRFAGSLAGGILGVSGALLMVFPPLVYSAAKRIETFRTWATKRVSVGTLLTWHVYTSIIGAILAILHTGHRFESPLGIGLTATMLLTVLSGFVGRYYLGYAVTEIHEKQALLNQLATQYNQLLNESARQPDEGLAYVTSRRSFLQTLNSLMGLEPAELIDSAPVAVRAARLAESIADLEYAIETHTRLKRRTARWLMAHLLTSGLFYLLLGLHIGSSLYFGLRWFSDI